MVLNFFGRGAGFQNEHTSAYFFTKNKELVIIDCPDVTYNKIKNIGISQYDEIYILVTHTHGDHIGSLGLTVQYANWVLHKPVTIVAPSEAVQQDIRTLLLIEGVTDEWYKLVTAKEVKNKAWFVRSILTDHVPSLARKCFGYHLKVNGTNLIYTGDTATLEPYMPFLKRGYELYVDTSVYYGEVHLKLVDVLKTFVDLTEIGVKVYLMHLDDASAAERIVKDYANINVVEVKQ